MRFFRAVGVVTLAILLMPLLLAQERADDEKSPKALTVLGNQWRKDISSPNAKTRLGAVEGFIAVAKESSRGISTLRRGLEDQDAEVRARAAAGFALYGMPNLQLAVPALVKALDEDRVPEVRVNAARALGGILFLGSHAELAKIAVPAMVRALRNDDDTLVRRTACKALGNIGPNANAAAPHLFLLMKDKDDDFMRKLAERAFFDVIGPQATEMLPPLLDWYAKGIDDTDRAANVLMALGKIADKEEVILPLFRGILKDPKQAKLHGGAAMAIGYMGAKGKPAIPDLIKGLDDYRSDPDRMQPMFFYALNELGANATSAIPELKKFAADPRSNQRTRDAVERLINNINKAAGVPK